MVRLKLCLNPKESIGASVFFIVIIALVPILSSIFYNLGYSRGFHGGVSDGYSDGYDQGYHDNVPDHIPNATLSISAIPDLTAYWYWNDTYINATQDINWRISCDLYRQEEIDSILQSLTLLEQWYYNDTGESTVDNYPETGSFGTLNRTSGLSLNFELYYNQTSDRIEPIQTTIYGDLTGEYIMSNAIDFEFLNDSAETFWKYGISFYIGSGEFGNFYSEYISILANSGMQENDTAGDWFAYWVEKIDTVYDPLKIDLSDGQDVSIEFGNVNVLQKENIMYIGMDRLEKLMDYNKNGVQYIVNSSGTHVIV